MSQHDFVIDNGPGLAVRTDINAAFQALVGNNAGPTEPTTKYAGMLWLDTTILPDGLLRQRNQANTAWVTPTTQPATAGNIAVTVLTSSGTWTKPTGLRFLEVWVVGGGGGGHRAAVTAASQSSASTGGGGGGTVFKFYAAADLSATEAFTIGAGGASPSGISAAGGTSTFKGLTAGGGSAGSGTTAVTTTPTNTTISAGGTASGGDLNLVGGNSEIGVACWMSRSGVALGGSGGSSFYAVPSAYSNPTTATVLNPLAGNFPGGGGSGGAAGPSQTPATGAVGGAGCIIIKEIF